MSHLRAALSLLAITAVALPLIPIQSLMVRFNTGNKTYLPRLFHRAVRAIVGIKIVQIGDIATNRPLLFAINHASWLDITVFGALTPVSYIAKSEVASWPVFGLFARLQRTVFVERNRHRTANHRDDILERFDAGERIGLFPEGTSSDGNRVLPFKSAFFAVAEHRTNGQPLPVQPVSIAYVGLEGLPLGRDERHRFAWYADMDLAPHLWGVLAAGRLTVSVQFHPVVTIEQFGSRKELARYCEATVAQGVSAAISGRLPNNVAGFFPANTDPVGAA
ncbi:MAG: lysophospholipid acyltransferase family protein [Proteobacteria bacterium]|nr:lysophospholipid acyltransferase family protein [Pseudomonadota bacterium]